MFWSLLLQKCQMTFLVNIGIKDGVWICLFEEDVIKQLALVLRYGLLKVFEINQHQHSNDVKEKLFQYLISPEFIN